MFQCGMGGYGEYQGGGVNSQYITHIIRPLPSVPALKQAVSWQFSLNVKSNEKLDMCRTALVAIEFEEGEGKFKGAVAPPPSSNADAKSSSMLFSMCFISVAHFFFSSIWIKFQSHHYCLQCISVPNLTLKEVDGGKREGGKRVVSNRDAKCKLWRTNTTSSASSFFLASATLLTSLPSVFYLFVLKSFYSFFWICRRAKGHELDQKKERNWFKKGVKVIKGIEW